MSHMTELGYAKAAAVLSVVYAGMNIFQVLSGLEDVRRRAAQFRAVAGDPEQAGRLVFIRALFYLGLPLLYLGTLLGAGIPEIVLFAAGGKLWLSTILGLAVERRLLRGGEYRPRDHLLSRLDACLNLLMTAAVILFLLAPQ